MLFDLGGTLLLESSHEVEEVSSRIAEEVGLGSGFVCGKVFRLFGLRGDVCESSLDAVAYYYAAAEELMRSLLSVMRLGVGGDDAETA